MTPTEKEIEIAISAVGSVLHNHAASYCNGLALRNLYEERKAKFLNDLTQHPAVYPLNIPNATSHVVGIIRSDYLSEIASLKLALDLSEASPDFIEAYTLLQPLVDEVRRLEAKHQDEIIERGRILNQLREAEEAARAKADAALDRDPAIIKAREALAAITPKPPEPPPAPQREPGLTAIVSSKDRAMATA